ncbi:MAG TPA: glycosyl hydrolase family 28-related protein [Methanosarcina sp.]|nr:glycosyl hydrolase family 28-related protein [Methanosarcina sp.]
MAITQISQIQVRRGLHQDLPQLAGGEFGWSVDSQRLYIGNGTLTEGAPAQGVTEVLTEHSNFLGSSIKYTFQGTNSGYTSQTGISPTIPVQQSLQDFLDLMVNVKNFGAKGDGVTDDTAAINRAIHEIYTSVSNLNVTHTNVRRIIRFPAGKYLITGTILLPPNCYIHGEGRNNTLLYGTGTTTIASCDSLFQTGANLGFNGAILPNFITVVDLAIQSPTSAPVVSFTSVTDAILERVQFIGGTYSIAISGTSSAISLINCDYSGYVTAPTSVASTVTGVVVKSGSLDTTAVSLSAGTTLITTVPSGAGFMQYQISDTGGNTRIGTMTFTTSSTGTHTFVDNSVEPAASLGANLFMYANGYTTCSVTTASTFKYNIKQFI